MPVHRVIPSCYLSDFNPFPTVLSATMVTHLAPSSCSNTFASKSLFPTLRGTPRNRRRSHNAIRSRRTAQTDCLSQRHSSLTAFILNEAKLSQTAGVHFLRLGECHGRARHEVHTRVVFWKTSSAKIRISHIEKFRRYCGYFKWVHTGNLTPFAALRPRGCKYM